MRKDSIPYNILIVEDNLGDYILIEEYLAENILEVSLLRAENFLEAKKILLKARNKFDVIFLDITLIDLSGEQLITQMIEIASGSPVIALTGFSDLEFSKRSLSLGVSDYLLKDDLTPIILYKSIIYSIQRSRFIDQIQKSEKRYSDLFQLSPIPMWVYDLETLAFMNINKAAINHYGYSEAEFLTMSTLDIRHVDEIDKLTNAIEIARDNISFNYRNVLYHKKKSGDIIMVEATSKQLIFNDKQSILVLINDITDRNKHIQTIEKQNQAFSEIAWIQSHVVRAPLARLLGLVNLMEMELTVKDEEISSLMNYIKDSADELDQIIKEISEKSHIIKRLDRHES